MNKNDPSLTDIFRVAQQAAEAQTKVWIRAVLREMALVSLRHCSLVVTVKSTKNNDDYNDNDDNNKNDTAAATEDSTGATATETATAAVAFVPEIPATTTTEISLKENGLSVAQAHCRKVADAWKKGLQAMGHFRVAQWIDQVIEAEEDVLYYTPPADGSGEVGRSSKTSSEEDGSKIRGGRRKDKNIDDGNSNTYNNRSSSSDSKKTDEHEDDDEDKKMSASNDILQSISSSSEQQPPQSPSAVSAAVAAATTTMATTKSKTAVTPLGRLKRLGDHLLSSSTIANSQQQQQQEQPYDIEAALKTIDELGLRGDTDWPYDWTLIQKKSNEIHTRLNPSRAPDTVISVVPKAHLQQQQEEQEKEQQKRSKSKKRKMTRKNVRDQDDNDNKCNDDESNDSVQIEKGVTRGLECNSGGESNDDDENDVDDNDEEGKTEENDSAARTTTLSLNESQRYAEQLLISRKRKSSGGKNRAFQEPSQLPPPPPPTTASKLANKKEDDQPRPPCDVDREQWHWETVRNQLIQELKDRNMDGQLEHCLHDQKSEEDDDDDDDDNGNRKCKDDLVNDKDDDEEAIAAKKGTDKEENQKHGNAKMKVGSHHEKESVACGASPFNILLGPLVDTGRFHYWNQQFEDFGGGPSSNYGGNHQQLPQKQEHRTDRQLRLDKRKAIKERLGDHHEEKDYSGTGKFSRSRIYQTVGGSGIGGVGGGENNWWDFDLGHCTLEFVDPVTKHRELYCFGSLEAIVLNEDI